MKLKFLGSQFNLASLAVVLIIGAAIGFYTLCSNSMLEGFGSFGAPVNYIMGTDVPGDTWTQPLTNISTAYANMYAPLASNVGGKVPLPENELFFFYNNKFSPYCCFKPQQYSSSTGCACISTEQMKYISSRGGNNTVS